ncbi:hypothetical protein NUH88_15105 [Nisaea acidiphila]|uniref:Uncharacterized protein n=1 Tax=Nisaea acidiphila TaxID=1862145 RepID=A0A9J7AP85_9PROT|nr:hypothetical protein [Nisaea acidiphila]UUX48730.1 hypothetical protein NUH88_15105 [Nisaea acidiphila]
MKGNTSGARFETSLKEMPFRLGMPGLPARADMVKTSASWLSVPRRKSSWS